VKIRVHTCRRRGSEYCELLIRAHIIFNNMVESHFRFLNCWMEDSLHRKSVQIFQFGLRNMVRTIVSKIPHVGTFFY
jgi:hypothetical protein